MSALDVAARGLARHALVSLENRDQGAVNLRARSAPTAAALEELAAAHPVLTGYAGDTHEIETAAHLSRVHLEGNGATLRNVNTTELSSGDTVQRTLHLGTSAIQTTSDFTYYAVTSVSGSVLTVGANAANFTAGDLVIVHGATGYTHLTFNIWRNIIRAKVLAVTATTVTLDRALPRQLIDDTPVIATTAEGVSSEIAGGPNYYLLDHPSLKNLTVVSDKGNPLAFGGCIGGRFRDLVIRGRTGPALNAMQDCIFEGIEVFAWRKIAELAEGSFGTTIRGLRGTLEDASTKKGGASDGGVFFMGIHENSAECVFEDFIVSSGPNDSGTANGCQLAAGRANEIRNSTLSFPAHTGPALAIQSNSMAGNPATDCGYRHVKVNAPVCSVFLHVGDAGAGVIRPYVENCTFFGTPTVRAANITGTDGVFRNLWFESGAVLLQPSGTLTNTVIEGCTIPGGFTNLTRALLQANPGIRNNESDASKRIAAAAIVDASQITITNTTPNQAFRTMTIAPGDLAGLDEVHFRLAGTTTGGGTNTRHVRVTCRIDGATAVEVAHMTSNVNGASWAVEGRIEVQSNLIVHAATKAFAGSASEVRDTRITGGDLAAHGLVLVVEVWTDTSGSVGTQLIKIAGQKAGMCSVPVFG